MASLIHYLEQKSLIKGKKEKKVQGYFPCINQVILQTSGKTMRECNYAYLFIYYPYWNDSISFHKCRCDHTPCKSHQRVSSVVCPAWKRDRAGWIVFVFFSFGAFSWVKHYQAQLQETIRKWRKWMGFKQNLSGWSLASNSNNTFQMGRPWR